MAKKASEMLRRANKEGSIRLRKDGKTWEGLYSYTDKNGKVSRRSVYGKTEQEVKDKLVLKRAEIVNKENLDPSTITLQQWADFWLKNNLLEIRESTRYQYEQNLRLYVYPVIGSTKLQSITSPMIQKVISKMYSDGRSPKTCKNVWSILHHLFDDAIVNEYRNDNPAFRKKIKLPKVVKKEMKVISGDAYSAFLHEIKGKPFENLFFVALFTGMREGEILGLKWDCVDVDSGMINIKRQLKRDSKIGEINSQYVIAETKTGNERKIYPDQPVIDAIRRERALQREYKLKYGDGYKNTMNLVFTDEFGHFINGRTLLKAFKKRAAAIGIPDLRFHDLRHSYATQSFKNGDSVPEVQRNLGHTTPATTLNVYAHCTEEQKKESGKRMGEFIKSLNSNAV